MPLIDGNLELGEAYTEELNNQFGHNTAQLVYDGMQYAPLPHSKDPTQTIDYLYLHPEDGDSDRPVLYVPGFTEGIVAKIPFGLELRDNGLSVIIPDQNRRGILRNPDGHKDPTYSQAMNTWLF